MRGVGISNFFSSIVQVAVIFYIISSAVIPIIVAYCSFGSNLYGGGANPRHLSGAVRGGGTGGGG